ncbi:sensor histidine kinase [Winogradskyella rapida]|uniref:histidine kinase n=1 Tax=Winogradskyella rapida TaxID=549701 RepID=A0ABW3KNF8_9FLAO
MNFIALTLKNIKSIAYNTFNSKAATFEANKYKHALELSQVGFWDWQVYKNEVHFSKESKHILGYPDDHSLNNVQFWNEQVHPEDREAYFESFKQFLEGLNLLYEHEYRVKCRNGQYKWILDKAKVVERDANQKATRIIGTHTDISKSKQSEDLLKKKLDVITNQNKRLYSFTHIVSHNLRTHIGNFKNILEFYNEATSETEKGTLMGHLQTISKSLSTTIKDLDDIVSIKSKSNISELNERVELYPFTSTIINSLSLESEKNEVRIHNDVRKEDVLMTNKAYLESILYNLISNAIKYSDPNKPSEVTIASMETESHVRILISDNGIGIDLNKFKDQVFEIYKTFHGTKRKDSRGIGLFITKTQVEALNGEIQVESNLNHGTAFSLSFKKQNAL